MTSKLVVAMLFAAVAAALFHTSEAASRGTLAVQGRTFKIYLKNGCDHDIEAAVQYKLNGRWIPKGWFDLAPGEKAYVADADGQYINTWAEVVGEDYCWDGKDCFTVRGKEVCGEEIDTGTQWRDYTHTFTCDDLTESHQQTATPKATTNTRSTTTTTTENSNSPGLVSSVIGATANWVRGG